MFSCHPEVANRQESVALGDAWEPWVFSVPGSRVTGSWSLMVDGCWGKQWRSSRVTNCVGRSMVGSMISDAIGDFLNPLLHLLLQAKSAAKSAVVYSLLFSTVVCHRSAGGPFGQHFMAVCLPFLLMGMVTGDLHAHEAHELLPAVGCTRRLHVLEVRIGKVCMEIQQNGGITHYYFLRFQRQDA